MHYVGVDLHKRSVVMSAEDEHGVRKDSGRFDSQDRSGIVRFFDNLKPFRCVIEVSSSYRWFHELISPLGGVILAHPLRLRAIVSGRAKTDKLDAALLARLLRAGLIPQAYILPREYQELRDLARARARLSQQASSAACELHSLLTRRNIRMPFANVFSKAAQRWLAELELGVVDGYLRDELTARVRHYRGEMTKLDVLLEEMKGGFPEHEALTALHGIGLVDHRGAGEAGAVRGRPTGGGVCGVDGAGEPVGRAESPRTHHAPGVALAAVDPGGGGDEAGATGPAVGKPLPADT